MGGRRLLQIGLLQIGLLQIGRSYGATGMGGRRLLQAAATDRSLLELRNSRATEVMNVASPGSKDGTKKKGEAS